MRLRVAELEFSASVAEVGERWVAVQFRAPKLEMHEALLAAAQRRERVLSSDDEREFRIADVSFAYVGSEPWGMHHHTWRLEQIVRLAGGSFHIAGLQLEPYEYREDVSADGVLRFALRASVTDAQLQALAQLSGSVVDVTREDEPARRMLLEGFVHGQSSQHGQAVAFVCTEQIEPRLALAGISTQDLSGVLLRKGILTLTELLDLRRVTDIDAWDL